MGGKFLTGSQTVWARKFRVRDCTIKGACVIESAVDVVLERNRIVTNFDGHSYAPVLVSFFCDDIWVLDNEIYDRTADAGGGLTEQAIVLWQWAGERAVARSAHPEAIAHFTKGLEALLALPGATRLPEHELSQLEVGRSWTATKGYAAPELERIYARARERWKIPLRGV